VETFVSEKPQKSNFDYQDPNIFIVKVVKGIFKKICLISVGSLIGEEVEFEETYQFKVKCISSSGFLLKFYLSEIKKVSMKHHFFLLFSMLILKSLT
jgi:hypothetical protein